MAGLHEVARQAGLKDEEAAEVFSAILARCKAGEWVTIKGFGTFKVKRSSSRVIRSSVLKDGVATVPAYERLSFKASPQTRREVKDEQSKGSAKGTGGRKESK